MLLFSQDRPQLEWKTHRLAFHNPHVATSAGHLDHRQLAAGAVRGCEGGPGTWRIAHSNTDKVRLTDAPEDVVRYLHGDRMIVFISCRLCGCTTHYEGADPQQASRMAVNVNMAEPTAIAGIPVRHFDGADTWKFLH